MNRLLGTLTLLLALAVVLPAQTTTGSMTGIVVDAQRAAITNASVTLTDQDKRTSLRASTDAEGRFVFPQVQPGRYTISVEAPGFKKADRKDIMLNANDKLSAGIFTMEIGAVEQTVEVSAQVVTLKTESSERSDAIIGKQLENIAVNSRSYLQLAAIVPGVVFTGNLTTGGHAGLANISANGARFDQNQLMLNGIGNVDTGNNGDQLATISLDAVQEFKMLTANYQAEYGRSSGAQISVVTKSGTTDFHGSGFLYHRHEGLNANNWKNNRDNLPRQKFRYNDPGYTIGGPVYIPGKFNKSKEKLFFFWSQEFQRQLKPQGRRDVTMPTELERAGDFSQSVDRNGTPFPYIKDPLATGPCSASNTSGCFNNGALGRIPASRLYAPGIALMKVLPLPNNPGNRGFNFSSQISDSYPRREDLVRIDANLSSRWRVFGHYLNNFDSVSSYYGSFVLGFNFPLVPITDTRPGRSMVLSATTIINPSTTNEVTWGFGHNQINIDPVNDGLTKTKLGLKDFPLLYPGAVQNDYIPRFGYGGSRINNSPSLGTNNAPFFNYNTTIDWIDNFSKIWNQHSFKAGVYAQRSRKDQTSFANSSGDFNFGDSSTNPLDTGFGLSNMALGVFSSFNQASKYATGKYRYTNLEWYAQDQWKVTRNFTLDYGMRFYWLQPQYDADLQTSTFLAERYDLAKRVRLFRPVFDASGQRVAQDPVTGQFQPVTSIGKIVPNSGEPFNGIVQAGAGFSKYLMENRGVHFSPRLGFAWDVSGEQKLVIRGGAAILYDRFQGNEVFDMLTNPPTTVAPTLVNSYTKDINPRDILLAPIGLNAFSPDGKVPTVYSYSFGVQAKLPLEMVLDTSYVGSQSRHQLQRLNINAIPYGMTFKPENQDRTKGTSGLLGSNALDADFLRPYPGYGNITIHQMGGTANYNSLQVGLNRRMTRGLFVQVAYTWSKALGTTGDRGNFHRIDNLTRFANYGPIGLDRRHNLAINYTYNIPACSPHFGNHWLARGALDGWQVSGFTRFQSGGPYGVGFSIPGVGSPQITGSYTEGSRVKLIGDPLQGVSGDEYHRLNPAAFAPPPVGSIGLDSPSNYLIGPGISNFDISLQKEFSAKERFRWQFRVDAFNAFNHTQYSGINSGINFTSLTNATPTNLAFNPDGSLRDKNGFGTVSGARDPRILQMMVRFQF